MRLFFHGDALKAEQRAAQDEYRASFAAYQQTVLTAFGQVAAALQALVNDAESLSAQQRALDSARASLGCRETASGSGAGRVQADGRRYVDVVKLL